MTNCKKSSASELGPSKQQMLELNMIKLILLRHRHTACLYNPIEVVCTAFQT